MSPEIDAIVELQGSEFKVIKSGTAAYEGRFTLNPRTSPHGIALIYTASIQPFFLGGPRPGVFQIEGDTLKWCFGVVGQPAPEGLNTFPGSESILVIYQKDPPTRRPPPPPLASRPLQFGEVVKWQRPGLFRNGNMTMFGYEAGR